MNALEIKSPVTSQQRQRRSQVAKFDNTRVIQSHVSLPRQHGIYLREKLKLWLDEADENGEKNNDNDGTNPDKNSSTPNPPSPKKTGF